MRGIRPPLLSIAGFDPTAGAGVLLDTAVFRRFGFPGLGIITAVTVQNSQGVRAFSCLGEPSVLSQYRALARDVSIGGIKVGMLGCGSNIPPVAEILAANKRVPRVVDPVLRSSSGKRLLEKEAIPRLISGFKGMISVVTPNMDEATSLSCVQADTLERMKEAARKISDALGSPAVVKGGHMSKTAVNVLYDGGRFYLFEKRKVRKDVHGTGCFFSSTLLSLLAMGHPLVEAVRVTTDITHEAIRNAVLLGKGRSMISPATLAGPPFIDFRRISRRAAPRRSVHRPGR
jgi:hydroxymethylpyrimidine kinase/phosphomethylpyrimidine kinase